MDNFALYIDGSLLGISIGLVNRVTGQIVFQESFLKRESTLSQLSTLTKKAFHKAGINSRDICKVYVASGPGSFSGIRMSLAFAQGFYLASLNRCELVACSSLSCYVFEKFNKLGRNICFFVNQTGYQGFFVMYSQVGLTMSKWSIKDSWPDLSGYCVFVSAKWDLLIANLKEKNVSFQLETVEDIAENSFKAFLLCDDVKRKEFVTDVRPIYLRPSSAEEQRERINL